MIVQIYEIQTPREAEECIALGVDHIGSVLLSKDEWRLPELKDVVLCSAGTGVKNSIIPLFRDRNLICKALDYYRPHFVHFCDSLTENSGRRKDIDDLVALQQDLRKTFPEIGIIRTIPVPRKGEAPDFPALELAGEMEPFSSLFLIDTWVGREPVEGFIGITGEAADREKAGELVRQSHIPVILAGGLSPANVYDALIEVIAAGADSCTGTNEVDGQGRPVRFKKDFAKVADFVAEIRRAGEALRDEEERLKKELEDRKEALKDREAALPAHSVRPHQILAIEALEEEIESLEEQLKRFGHNRFWSD